jgi:hypothetical protein
MDGKISVVRLVLKAALLFAAVVIVFSLVNPMPLLGRLTLYNWLLPGRERLPYSDYPGRSYNLNLYNLDAMFASLKLTGMPKASDEFRVFVIGDSSVWGFILQNKDTLAGALNAANLDSADGLRVVFYNLGYPVASLSKDLMILDYAMRYEPDLIIWPVTLEAFTWSRQTFSPLVQNNPTLMANLITDYRLPITINEDFTSDSFLDRSLIGQRRNLADIIRLQLYGFMWAATGIDVYILDEIELRATNLEADEDFAGLQPPDLHPKDLAFEVLAAGIERAKGVPVLIINEPIFVSDGANSDIRYNSFYPRWAYDGFRQLLQEQSDDLGWNYADLWQAVDNSEFTNTPIHLTPRGTLEFADQIIAILHDQFNLQP